MSTRTTAWLMAATLVTSIVGTHIAATITLHALVWIATHL